MSKSAPGQPTERIIEIAGRGIGAASETISTVGQRRGYTVGAVGPGSFRLERSTRPVWATGLAIVTMPLLGLGLLFLRIRTRESATVTVFEDRTGVKARVVGAVDAEVLEQLASAVQPDQRPVPSAAPSASRGAPVGFESPTAPQRPASSPQRVAPSAISAMPGSATASSGVIPAQQVPNSAPIVPSQVALPDVSDAADTDVDKTMARPVRSAPPTPPMTTPMRALRLLFPDGSERVVSGPLVIGRQPAPNVGDSPVVISDPSLSKSHVRIEPAGGGLLVTDLQSTNGSSIRTGRGVQQCVPGTPQPIGINEVLIAGEVEITVGAS